MSSHEYEKEGNSNLYASSDSNLQKWFEYFTQDETVLSNESPLARRTKELRESEERRRKWIEESRQQMERDRREREKAAAAADAQRTQPEKSEADEETGKRILEHETLAVSPVAQEEGKEGILPVKESPLEDEDGDELTVAEHLSVPVRPESLRPQLVSSSTQEGKKSNAKPAAKRSPTEEEKAPQPPPLVRTTGETREYKAKILSSIPRQKSMANDTNDGGRGTVHQTEDGDGKDTTNRNLYNYEEFNHLTSRPLLELESYSNALLKRMTSNTGEPHHRPPSKSTHSIKLPIANVEGILQSHAESLAQEHTLRASLAQHERSQQQLDAEFQQRLQLGWKEGEPAPYSGLDWQGMVQHFSPNAGDKKKRGDAV